MKLLNYQKKKINQNFFKDKKSLKLINLGRFTEQKDQITILKAVKILKDKINFKLLIMGRGIEKNNLLSYILKNNLSKEVKIINFQNNPYNLLKKVFSLFSKQTYSIYLFHFAIIYLIDVNNFFLDAQWLFLFYLASLFLFATLFYYTLEKIIIDNRPSYKK